MPLTTPGFTALAWTWAYTNTSYVLLRFDPAETQYSFLQVEENHPLKSDMN